MTASQRQWAEAALGHMQQAATEVILAAHDTLHILEEAVSSIAVSEVCDRLGAAGPRLARVWESAAAARSAGAASRPGAEAPPTAGAGDHDGGHDDGDGGAGRAGPRRSRPGRVQRIPVR